jgi:hypothetical protein
MRLASGRKHWERCLAWRSGQICNIVWSMSLGDIGARAFCGNGHLAGKIRLRGRGRNKGGRSFTATQSEPVALIELIYPPAIQNGIAKITSGFLDVMSRATFRSSDPSWQRPNTGTIEQPRKNYILSLHNHPRAHACRTCLDAMSFSSRLCNGSPLLIYPCLQH